MVRAMTPGFAVLRRAKLADLDEPDDNYWGEGRIFVKPRREHLPLRVGSEFLAARLANAVGIPTPAGEVGTDVDGRLCWVSAVVDIGGEDLGPEDPDDVAGRSPDTAAGIAVFDVWILNSDRWEANIVSHPKIGVWAIDHELAFGQCHVAPGATGFEEACLTRPLTEHYFRGVHLDPKRLEAWRQRIQSLPASVVNKAVREGKDRGLYDPKVEEALRGLLLQRASSLATLVRRSFPEPTSSDQASTALGDDSGAAGQ